VSDSPRDHLDHLGPDHVARARAVYDASVDGYLGFVGTEISAATEGPIDRAVLTAFVESLADARAGRVADLGCGPGRVAALFARCGFDVVGIDVSPAMVTAASAAHPGIEFHEGHLAALPLADGALAGAVCWYAIIHTPPDQLDAVAAELARVLMPGGELLVAFQAGTGDAVFRADAHGTGLPLTSFRHHPDSVTDALARAGLPVHTRVVREAQLPHETTPQAFLIARAEVNSRGR
jgi:SAM-dependent methyltransferase